MTRRIQPPKHPVTGHPFVDNALRNTWRSRRPELIRKNRAEAWEEGYTEGLLSGRRLERTGVELPHSNPYEK